MEILFHEFKIPRKIELWARLIPKETNTQDSRDDPPLTPPFSRLGNVTPNSNGTREFRTREFRTREKKMVQLQNLSATHIKLVMERPQEMKDVEKRNPLEQVGLVTLTLFGLIRDEVKISPAKETPSRELKLLQMTPTKQTTLRNIKVVHQNQKSSSSITDSTKRDIASTQTSFIFPRKEGMRSTPVNKVICSDEDLEKRLESLERLKRDRAKKEVSR